MTILALTTSLALADDTADPTVEVGLGKGLLVHGPDDVSFQIRARVQERLTLDVPGEDDEDPLLYFQVRRLRLVFLAKMPSKDLQLYVQLGFAPLDQESDLLIPLRDAVVTWQPARDFGLKIGQQKVPFNRERLISSSALQLVDRSFANAELNLDRDVGVQAFSNDLFGLGDHLAYQVGVFNGDGRNTFVGDLGLLYVARLEVRPLGEFEDAYVEADLSRDPRPRLAIAAGAAANVDTIREKSTFSGTFQAADFDYLHGEVDGIFKTSGFSLLAQAIVRSANEGEITADVDGNEITETSRSAWGGSVSAGYVFANGLQPAARYSWVEPLPDVESAVLSDQEIRVGLSWYFEGNDLKWQTDFGILGGEAHPDGEYEARTQLQVYF